MLPRPIFIVGLIVSLIMLFTMSSANSQIVEQPTIMECMTAEQAVTQMKKYDQTPTWVGGMAVMDGNTNELRYGDILITIGADQMFTIYFVPSTEVACTLAVGHGLNLVFEAAADKQSY